uniref:Uncharacterized protein n=1 Tax=Anopheles darlingi TaxID=43151 RepID=A0A2M4DGM8_ANODA
MVLSTQGGATVGVFLASFFFCLALRCSLFVTLDIIIWPGGGRRRAKVGLDDGGRQRLLDRPPWKKRRKPTGVVARRSRYAGPTDHRILHTQERET